MTTTNINLAPRRTSHRSTALSRVALRQVFFFSHSPPLATVHPLSLCVIGLVPSHISFKDEDGVTTVDFNVGKSDRSGIKVTGKRKKSLPLCCVKGSLLEVNQQLIKQPELLNVSYLIYGETAESYIWWSMGRCCRLMASKIKSKNTAEVMLSAVVALIVMGLYIKGAVVTRVVSRLGIGCKVQAHREGYIAIIMPKPADWLKIQASLVSLQEYKKLREINATSWIKNEKFLGVQQMPLHVSYVVVHGIHTFETHVAEIVLLGNKDDEVPVPIHAIY
ncbi:hypothetical protein VNO78_21948 [Psophocarpus tetragonolobus]|uniref:Uncharacterized protein n=1 Tax=Psophocarpus tetragonolobus TaxID=3891 RepID=A0AAN9SBW8_PSOTE